MGVALKLRRGTTAELNAFQGVSGEMVMDTTTNKVYVFDTASPPVKKEVGDSGLNTYDTNTNELTLDGVVYTITAVPVTSSIDTTGLADQITIGGNTLTLSDKASISGNQLTIGGTTVNIPPSLMSYDAVAGTVTIEDVDGSNSSTVVMDTVGAVITNNNNNIPTYATLPTTNNTVNDLAVWESNNRTYRWSGTQWLTSASDPIPSVSSYPLAATGTEAHGDTLLINGELYWWDATSGATVKWERLTPDPVQLAADIASASVETVSSLPVASSNNVGKVVIFNGKLYRNVENPVGTFTFDKIVLGFDELTGNLAANQITAGTITAGHLGTNSVTANKILAGSIATGHMGANSIAGDRIAAGTLSANTIDSNGITANYLKSGTTALASGISFGLGNNTSLAGKDAAGMFTSGLSSKFGLLVTNTNTGGLGAIAAGGRGSANNAVLGVGNGTSNNFTAYESLGAIGSGTIGGQFHHYTGGSLDRAVELASPTYAGYFTGDVHVTGNHYPFTGAHEALIDTANGVVVGDIVVDTEVITKSDISNTLCKVEVSSASEQKGVIGVYTKGMGDVIPSSLTDIEYVGEGVKTDKQITTKPEYESLVSSTDAIYINSLGEGQVNVCGEGGNLEIGDLIVTSSIQGKGKKQGDDIIRSTTVAKVRENVTFSTYSEVKQVACIYLCG